MLTFRILAAFLAAGCVAGPTAAVAASPNSRKPTVEVFGDRYGTLLGMGMNEADPAIPVSFATTDIASLSGPSYGEWLRTLRDKLGRSPQPDVAVIMVGEGDLGPLFDGGARLDPGTPAWTVAYGARIDAVAKLFAQARVPLVWVGLPPVRSPDGSSDASRIDGLLRDRAAADGVRFVDIWSGFTDDEGRYAPDGPDVEGHAARLRRGEGFTQAGMRKLASYVSPVVERVIGQKAASTPDLANLTIERARDFDAALAIDVNAQIRREAARGGAEPAVASGGPAPSGPVAGPIVSLTSVAAPAGADLAALPAPDGASLPAAQAADAVAPAPGRADDFSWPKPGSSP